MHWLKCTLLTVILCAAFWQYSASETEMPIKAAESIITVDPKENEVNFQHTDSAGFFATEKISNITGNLTQGNLTAEPDMSNLTSLNADVPISLNQKRDVENVTFNDIKPFLLFPILPFFFPPKEDESLNSDKNEFSISKNKTSKNDGSPTDAKPFIFSSFSFIRRIPLNNRTASSNDSKIINVKRLSFRESDDLKTNSQKTRKRRNSSNKIDDHGFFDDSSLFPDSELDEFLPKPDLFFPDLPFHHKPLKKLSRRKRDQKKPDFKNDLKFFFDAFDEAFMRTKRELERADPILNFLRGGEQPFEEKKEEDDFFNPLPAVQEKPVMKWKIQRNIKRLNNDHQSKLPNGQESPMIIVDKVVKIGEFHVHDEGNDKDKSKKKKREGNNSKKENLEVAPYENDETFPKSIFELIKQEENKRKKRDHLAKSEGQAFTKVRSEEIRILPQTNTSFLSVGNNSTIEIKKKEAEIDPQKANITDKTLKYKNFIKVIDSLKTKIKEELTNSVGSPGGRQKRKGLDHVDEVKSIKASYDNLKKNITELLIKFLELAKNLDDAELFERLEIGERNHAGVFDWTEKETLQGTNMLGKNSREKRQKKDADFEDEYADVGKKERQFADLNYLFLTVTLPIVFIFAMALLVCFFSLQIKGKFCSKLFRPRQVFIVEDENSTRFSSSAGNKPQLKAQAI